ncbi:MAG: hypothetical protein A3I75_01915 [Deltaproteobacteria bacterium RIFCSPLOWO2_02_FULL_50_16]|nr:MAG: hypothetical protein A2053_03765 [Deltaproteobacteria bacterium GWA2_50_8]OGQ25691.1 MAG: hypothetical protein A3B79_07080 [Deltaproteobacteria bacterium RIFCSPHIGHO2_02_FULL_50_15]OGQ56954.1 MAG: hypothetical protein A3I75_01915 [Deltaproteobacteria bacterium RIFCSPLOWO2_02_FULL_50_16]
MLEILRPIKPAFNNIFGKRHGRLFVVLSIVFFLSFIFVPHPHPEWSVCAVKNFIGLPCPGCGLTHSFSSLSHGRFVESFRWHPLGPLLYGVLLFFWIQSLLMLLGRRASPGFMRKEVNIRLWGKIFVVLFMVQWIVRLILDT